MERGRRHFNFGLLAMLSASPVSGSAASMGGGKTHTVDIVGAAFVPASIELSPGDRVTWTNRDIVPHTATALDESWDSGILNRGEQYTHTFDTAVSADYFCKLHPGMRAKLLF